MTVMAQDKVKQFGKLLVEKKIITQEDLQEALLAQQASGVRLGQFLLKKGLATEAQLLDCLADQYGLKALPHIDFEDPDKMFASIPVAFLKKNRIIPYSLNTKKKIINIAIADPLNIQPLDDLKMLFPGHRMNIVLSTPDEIQRIISTHFDMLKSESTDDVIEDLEESDFEILTSQISETEDIMDMANDAPIIRLVNTIIKQAVTDRASDIHIEPYEKDLIVRFRIDGILYQMFTPPKKYQGAVMSRIKIMANLNIAENRLPQDGRIQLKIGGKDIDIRVSTFPTYYGERIVLRLLNKTDMYFDLNSLGFDDDTLSTFNDVIKKTHGIILVTGPTGSGKSTTLYSVLTRLNTDDVNILTVEDPIEYQLKGIGQMQVATQDRTDVRERPEVHTETGPGHHNDR